VNASPSRFDAPSAPVRSKSKFNWKVLTIVALVLGGLCVIACVALFAFSGMGKVATDAASFQGAVGPGKPAPDFELTALDGKTYQLSDLQGQPVVVTFGATWCPDCRVEAPQLQSVHESYPDLAILAVDTKESQALVQSYVDELSLSYTTLLDPDGTVNDRYHVYAIPTLFFIDKQGVIQAVLIEKLTSEQMQASLEKIGVK
jgi:cytochrome c biogenesis protein CcmG, thiol:disulfide interchange protein DsbE